jgi:predicted dehydrogenase
MTFPAVSDAIQTVVLSGIGGYGGHYLRLLRPLAEAGRARLIGAIDPAAERAADYPGLQAAGVPVWRDFDAFLAAGVKPALLVVAAPIQFHAGQSCAALAAGIGVLCEKPAAATAAEAAAMAAAAAAAGRLLAVGYQMSYSTAVQAAKADLLAGRYGAPRRFRTWAAWPRTSAYYGRNRWAGRIRDDAGRAVNDSPVNNACAHYLHNMLYLLGPTPAAAAAPARVEAELYRANPIENFDAAGLRVTTDSGVEVLFHVAHCVDATIGPEFVLECERGELRYAAGPGATLVGRTAGGETRDYGDPNAGPERKLTVSLEAASAGRTDSPCGIAAAAMHTAVVDALQRLPIHDFAPAAIARRETKPGEILTFVPGLVDDLRRCYDDGRLFSEAGLPWAGAAGSVHCPTAGGR